jgi:RimJ/RimL family protein N-acetyltransferase
VLAQPGARIRVGLLIDLTTAGSRIEGTDSRIMKFRKKHKPPQSPDDRAYGLRTLASDRLRLVAANRELVEADLARGEAFGNMLRAAVPPNWPPDLYDRDAMEFALRQPDDAAEQGWSFWYLIAAPDGREEVIGICGFKGRPNTAGSAEIGYSVLRQYRNQGFATEAVERLVRWAFSHHNVVEVSAETLPHLQSSIRVMKKNGFVHAGEGSERGVVRYAVQRPDRR